jgi:hypothetical protein
LMLTIAVEVRADSELARNRRHRRGTRGLSVNSETGGGLRRLTGSGQCLLRRSRQRSSSFSDNIAGHQAPANRLATLRNLGYATHLGIG